MSVYKMCFSVPSPLGSVGVTILEDGVVKYFGTRQEMYVWWNLVPTGWYYLTTPGVTPYSTYYIKFDSAQSPTRCYFSLDGSTVAYTFVVTSDARGAVLPTGHGNSGDYLSYYNSSYSGALTAHTESDTYNDPNKPGTGPYAYTFWLEENAEPEPTYYVELCRFDHPNTPSLFLGTLSSGYDSFVFRCYADPSLIDSNVTISSIVATIDGSSTTTQLRKLSNDSDYWETALLHLEQPTTTLTGLGTYYIPHTVKFTTTFSDNTTRESDTYYFVSLLKNGPTTPEKTFYQGVYDANSHWICDTPTGYYNDSGSLVALSEGNDAWVSLVEGDWTSIVTNLLTVSAAGSYSSTVGYIPSDSNVLFYGEGTAIISQKKLSISGAKISTKNYNASTAATVNLSSAVISGIESGDDVTVSGTGVFENYDYGNQKNVTVTYALSGADKDNYLPPDSETLKGNINKRRLTVSAENITILDKDYDGTTRADVSFSTFGNTMSVDIGKVSVSAVGTFVTSASSSTGDPNVGENKPVRIVFSVGAGASGDRSFCYAAPNTNSGLTADINARPINISNIQSQSN